jgi:hypothetical protein
VRRPQVLGVVGIQAQLDQLGPGYRVVVRFTCTLVPADVAQRADAQADGPCCAPSPALASCVYAHQRVCSVPQCSTGDSGVAVTRIHTTYDVRAAGTATRSDHNA